MCQKSKFCEKVPTVVWTHYLQSILTVGTLPNLTFSHLAATKMHVCSAWCLGCRPGAEKWREWGSLGSPRVPKDFPMPPKTLPKIVQNHHPSPGLPATVLPGCLGYPAAPKMLPFLMFSPPALPHVRGTFTSPLPLSATPHSVPRANVKHPSSAAVWAYAHLNNKLWNNIKMTV